ncbi:prevent-host-death family protein [Micromonospora citrea]|uniref:Antitoxin n=1 Tax=Micromonospora citrea TaxID=47855 RepID=A0A1C6UVI9_9ACTN|nr:type II toxin-antitoxin system prevent-host-death family antitoxin [Micromonospora citrea]SCL58057.1 prevent-host-death family protein [Micromonospora citrea]
MEQIAIRELNQHTSRVLARVRAGETVEVTDRGEPIARLVPIVVGDALLARLVAEGRATAPTAAAPLPTPPIRRLLDAAKAVGLPVASPGLG